jgi:hypothetical protein
MDMSDCTEERPRDHLRAVADRIAAGVLDRSLPKSRWTHEGHLLACTSLVRRHGPVDALRILRDAIPRYNEATGVANTATSGYHDTITVYFVWAIHRLVDAGSANSDVLLHPLVDRRALLEWWDPATLMSPAARAAWVEPTRAGEGVAPMEWLQREPADT